MQSSAKVVVVGGGIGGLSALYHLCLEGWTDVVLLERNELTSGTTWHSAAQCPSIAFSQLLLLLRDYTIKLYRELAADPAYPINYHHGTGGVRLLTNPVHLDEAHHIMSVAKGLNLDIDLLDPAEIKRKPASRHRWCAGRALGRAGRRYRSCAALPGAGSPRAPGRGQHLAQYAGDRAETVAQR